MTTTQFYGQFGPLIEATKQLPNAPPALFPIKEQK
jgi:hypothetical protein